MSRSLEAHLERLQFVCLSKISDGSGVTGFYDKKIFGWGRQGCDKAFLVYMAHFYFDVQLDQDRLQVVKLPLFLKIFTRETWTWTHFVFGSRFDTVQSAIMIHLCYQVVIHKNIKGCLRFLER